MRIVIPAKVCSLEEKTQTLSSDKDKDTGKTMITTRVIGWFACFEGSHESLFVGTEKPTDMDPGREARIIILTGSDIKD